MDQDGRTFNNGTATTGNGLVAFSTSGATPRVRTAFSSNWLAAMPTWNVRKSDDASATIRWPVPANLCEIYSDANECGGLAPNWYTSGHYDTAIQALGTGLDRVAAVVTTCGLGIGSINQNVDICLAISLDGGDKFTHTQLLSVKADDGSETGGVIDPLSVQASLAWTSERTNGLSGDVGLPIYVSWRNHDGNAGRWWFTRVVVGTSGTVAETTPPRELPSIPNSTLDITTRNQATVFGYRINGLERIGLAFSDHVAKSTLISCSGAAPVDTKDDVTWKVVESEDLGITWGCFKGSSGSCIANTVSGVTTIANDSKWDLCAGLTRTTGGLPTQFRTVNSSRPQVAMIATPTGTGQESDYDKNWFFALNHNLAVSDNKLHAHVYRAGGIYDIAGANQTYTQIKMLAVSPLETAQTDAWQQALTTVQGSLAAGRPPSVIMAYLAAYNADHSAPAGMKVRGMTFVNPIVTNAPLPTLQHFDISPTTGSGVTIPFPFESDISGFMGVSNYQGCASITSECPGATTGFTYPAVPFFAAWPDSRSNTKTVSDVFSRWFTL